MIAIIILIIIISSINGSMYVICVSAFPFPLLFS